MEAKINKEGEFDAIRLYPNPEMSRVIHTGSWEECLAAVSRESYKDGNSSSTISCGFIILPKGSEFPTKAIEKF